MDIILIKVKFRLTLIFGHVVEFEGLVIPVGKVRAFCSVDNVKQDEFFIVDDARIINIKKGNPGLSYKFVIIRYSL